MRGEVVDLVGLHFLNDADQVGAVRQVAIVQVEALVVDVRVLVDILDPSRVETGRPALHPVDFATLLQQQVGKVSAILVGHPGNQGCLLD